MPLCVQISLQPNFTDQYWINIVFKTISELGNDGIQLLIDEGALPCLILVFDPAEEYEDYEYLAACETVANMFSGNERQIQALVDAQFVPSLVRLVWEPTDCYPYNYNREACLALLNAASGASPEQVDYLVGKDILAVLSAGFDGERVCPVDDFDLFPSPLVAIEDICRAGDKKSTTGQNPYVEIVTKDPNFVQFLAEESERQKKLQVECRRMLIEMCIGLRALDLPVLVLLEILGFSCRLRWIALLSVQLGDVSVQVHDPQCGRDAPLKRHVCWNIAKLIKQKSF